MNASITAQEGFLQVKLPQSTPLKPIGGKRRRIKKYSKAARKRFLDMFAQMRITRKHQMVFITLTYGNEYPTEKRAKQNLWAFWMRLKRKNPRLAGVWRMEHQKRNAPHFHLLLINWKFTPYDDLAQMWHDIIKIENSANYEAETDDHRIIIDSEDPALIGERLEGIVNDLPMVNIETVKGKRMAQNYVAKYVAKWDEESEQRNADSSFNDVAYLDERSESSAVEPETTVGRFWGVWNKHLLPFGVVTAIPVKIKPETFGRWLFSASMKYGNVGKSKDGQFAFKEQGFTLYVENAHKWLRYFLQVHIESWEHDTYTLTQVPLTANANQCCIPVAMPAI